MFIQRKHLDSNFTQFDQTSNDLRIEYCNRYGPHILYIYSIVVTMFVVLRFPVCGFPEYISRCLICDIGFGIFNESISTCIGDRFHYSDFVLFIMSTSYIHSGCSQPLTKYIYEAMIRMNLRSPNNAMVVKQRDQLIKSKLTAHLLFEEVILFSGVGGEDRIHRWSKPWPNWGRHIVLILNSNNYFR